MIVHFADQLTSHSDHLPESERSLIVQLKKVLHNVGYNQSGALAGRPNLLTLVAAHLGKVPAWFYQDNPLLALVQIPRPSWLERKSFLSNFAKHFHEGEKLPPEKIPEIAREFADLTDGLTAWDLESVRRTSRAEQLTVAQPKALVDYYKYGRRDDPWERLDPARIRVAQEELGKRVIGQPSAVDAVVRMLLSARIGITLAGGSAKKGKPKGTFFFVGPTGVGKTELAKALSEFLFGDDSAFARFDMSEYAEQHAAEKLTGSPPGYVGYEEGGHLTNRVRERPFSLLLFDEIEKAHGRVMDKFLQVLEDGRLTDGKGQTAFFSQSVVIFTSNIGSDTLDLSPSGEGLPRYEAVRDHYLAAVRSHFTRPPAQGGLGRPELLNRLGDNILVFDMLRPEYTAGICKKFLALLAESAKERSGLILDYPDGSVVEMIRREMDTASNLLFGGRRIKSLLETLVEQPLNQWIFFNSPRPATRLSLTVESGTATLRINGTRIDVS
jgi:ATP-dependent Clp protease ATP-binding subunit ClpA